MSSEIQKERTRQYFIESAKSILKSEGVAAATARNIASKAGYSYATLYQYFKDTRNLLFVCAVDFLEECAVFTKEHCKSGLEPKEELIDLSINFLKYFIQYPGIYQLLFVESSANFTGSNPMNDEIEKTFDKIFGENLRKFENSDTIKIAHEGLLVGISHLYLNRKQSIEYFAVIENLRNSLKLILD